MTPISDMTLAFLGNLGGVDLLVIAFIGLLLFGKRLPDVGKNLGQAIVGFKKGLKATGDEVKEGTEVLHERVDLDDVPAGKKVKATVVSKPKKALQVSEEP